MALVSVLSKDNRTHKTIMSERRTILSRPRTKVYESNYNIGESYYKPMMDQLDRKYSGRPLLSPSPPRDFTSSRRALDDEFLRDKDLERASSQSRASRIKEDFLERASHAQKDADSFFDRHGRRTEADHFLDRASHRSETQDFFDKATKAEESFAEKSQSLRNKADAFVEKALSRATLDEEDDAIESQLKRIKEKRAAKAAAREEDLEFTLNGIKPTSQVLKYKFGFHDKMLDTVGIDGRYQERLLDDIIRRREEPPLEFPEENLPAFPIVGKWTKLNDLSEAEITAISAASDSQSQLRARQSQIKVSNINSELADLQERTEARARRRAELQSLLTENDNLSQLSQANHERTLAHENALALRDLTHDKYLSHGLRDISANVFGRDLSHNALGLRDLSHDALGLRTLSHNTLGLRESSHVNHQSSLSHLSHGERSYGLGLKSIAF